MYTVRLVDLPPKVRGMVVKDGDDLTIILNSRLSREQNMKTYLHEKRHIERGDFDKEGMDVNQIEKEAHEQD